MSEQRSDLWTAYAASRESGGGLRFSSREVAENYQYRPPYSPEVYETLLRVMGNTEQAVLDLGSGPGKIARELAPHVARVDAIELSEDMITVGRTLPGGERSNVRWTCSTVEEAPLDPPYGLATAGASIHWFNVDVVLERLWSALTQNAPLAVLDGDHPWQPPWEADEREIIIEYLTRATGKKPEWRETIFEIDRILDHPRFAYVDRVVTQPHPVSQSIDEYLSCQRSRSALTPDSLGPELSASFELDLRALLEPFTKDGTLTYGVRTRIEWGTVAR